MTEQIIIEWISDPSGLQATEDKLATLGKVDAQAAQVFKQTNAELKKREQNIASVSNANTKLKTSYDGLRTAVLKESQVLKMSAEEFKKTGKTLEQLVNEMKGATTETKKNTDETVKSATAHKSLRTELRQITEQLARLKLENRDNTKEFAQLTAQAGRLKDAIGDVNRQVSVLASDTTTFDGLISGAQGVAGAFALAQGAAALFGDDSEELQETLLRVNAAMAILQGLQQIGNVLQKESAASRLVDVLATKAQIAAQTVFNFVIGKSTGLLKVFKLALAATGVGLLIIGLVALVSALSSATESMDEFNDELERNKKLLDADLKALNDRTELELASAKARGAAESELIKIKGRGLQQNIRAIDDENKTLTSQRDALDKTSEKWSILNQTISENVDTRKDLVRETKILEQDLRGALVDEALRSQKATAEARVLLTKEGSKEELNAKINAIRVGASVDLASASLTAGERLKIERNAAKQINDLRKEFTIDELNDFKASVEIRLLASKKGSVEELDLKKKLANAQLQIDLENEKLSDNQRKLLVQQFFKERIALDKEFAKGSLENIISGLNAELQEIDISNKAKENLTVELLETQRRLELASVIDNKQKEKEINAKFDKEISEQSVAIRRAALDEELQLLTAQQGEETRFFQRVLSAQTEYNSASTKLEEDRIKKKTGIEKLNIDQIISIINRQLEFEQDSIKKRSDLNKSLYKDGSISAKAFFLTNAELIDAEAKAVEDAEEKKRIAIDQTNEKRKLTNQELITAAFETTRQTLDTLATLYDFINTRELNALEAQRQRIKDLQDAGAISEKEAKERFKRLDVEERKNKQQAAQRTKALEVFNAILAIPAAFLKGLKDGGYFLAALYAGLAGAKAALIAAKPIPKFAKGKKGQYEGPAEVGEAGTELIEKGGKMYVADKPQIIWLAKSDKVYNPKETIDMINRPLPKIDKRIMNFSSTASNNMSIDYKKLGEAVGKSIPSHVVTIDDKGVTHIVNHNNSYTEYLDKRRRF